MCNQCRDQQEMELLPEFETLMDGNMELESEVQNIFTGLPKIKHYTTVKQLNSSGKFTVTGVGEMNVRNMNPGFFDRDNKLIAAPKLQQSLIGLITSKYKKYVKSTSPSVNDQFSIALVDLSGDKINNPEYAGWGSTTARYAASTAKMAILYGVIQLRFDLENYFKANGVANLADVSKWIGNFQKEFNYRASSLTGIDFLFTKKSHQVLSLLNQGLIYILLSSILLKKMIIPQHQNYYIVFPTLT